MIQIHAAWCYDHLMDGNKIKVMLDNKLPTMTNINMTIQKVFNPNFTVGGGGGGIKLMKPL